MLIGMQGCPFGPELGWQHFFEVSKFGWTCPTSVSNFGMWISRSPDQIELGFLGDVQVFNFFINIHIKIYNKMDITPINIKNNPVMGIVSVGGDTH